MASAYPTPLPGTTYPDVECPACGRKPKTLTEVKMGGATYFNCDGRSQWWSCPVPTGRTYSTSWLPPHMPESVLAWEPE